MTGRNGKVGWSEGQYFSVPLCQILFHTAYSSGACAHTRMHARAHGIYLSLFHTVSLSLVSKQASPPPPLHTHTHSLSLSLSLSLSHTHTHTHTHNVRARTCGRQHSSTPVSDRSVRVCQQRELALGGTPPLVTFGE